MANERLNDAVKNAQERKAPERDLWPGIEFAIEQDRLRATSPQKKSSMPLYAVAASMVLAVTISVGSFYTGQQSKSLVIAEQMSEDYLAKREALLVALEDTAVTVNDLEVQLANLDDAADAIKKAIAEDPNNPVLLQMLKRVYAQQIELIEKVHAPRWQQL